MAQMTMVQAINSAMDIMLNRDPDVVLMGEDIGYFGGVFPLHRRSAAQIRRTPRARHADRRRRHSRCGDRHGRKRFAPGRRNPIRGLHLSGFRSADEHAGPPALSQRRGFLVAPVTIRTPCGGGIRGGQTHSQSPEGIFTHVCGIKVVMPSNPYDAKGLLISSIEDDDPVIFFEPKRLYNGPFDGDPNKPAVPWSTKPKGEVPEGYYSVPIGKAEIVRKGADVTVLTYGTMVHVAQAAAQRAKIDAEIIDVRTMVPLDVDTICTSVKKTGRCVIAHEATRVQRLRRGAVGDRAGRVLLVAAGADHACHRVGHAVSARVRMGVFSRPGARDRGAASGDGGERMSRFEFKLPDLGEGTIEAEIVEWKVKPGDRVTEEDVIVDVMTDKANIELPSPVTGTVIATTGEPGDMVAVGATLIVFETDAVRTRPRLRRRT